MRHGLALRMAAHGARSQARRVHPRPTRGARLALGVLPVVIAAYYALVGVAAVFSVFVLVLGPDRALRVVGPLFGR